MFGKILVIIAVLQISSASILDEFNAPIKEETCRNVENMEHPDVPNFRWQFFGNIEGLNTTNKLVVNATHGYNFFYNEISFDLDDQYQNLAMDMSIYMTSFIKIFTKKDGIYDDENKKSPVPVNLGESFLFEVRVIEMGLGWGRYGYLMYINGKFYGIFEEKTGLELSKVNYISFINNMHVDSVKICDL